MQSQYHALHYSASRGKNDGNNMYRVIYKPPFRSRVSKNNVKGQHARWCNCII